MQGFLSVTLRCLSVVLSNLFNSQYRDLNKNARANVHITYGI